jgi:hypothetical protein
MTILKKFLIEDNNNKAKTHTLPKEWATQKAADNYFAKAKADQNKKNYSGNTTYIEGGVTEYDKGLSANQVGNSETIKSLRNANGANDLKNAFTAIIIVVCVGSFVYAITRK